MSAKRKSIINIPVPPQAKISFRIRDNHAKEEFVISDLYWFEENMMHENDGSSWFVILDIIIESEV